MLPRRRRAWASWSSGSPTLFRPFLRICPLCRFDQFEECTSVLAGPSTVPALAADSLASYIGIGSLPLARWWPGIAGEVSRGQACTTRASGQRLSLCPTPGTSTTTTTTAGAGSRIATLSAAQPHCYGMTIHRPQRFVYAGHHHRKDLLIGRTTRGGPPTRARCRGACCGIDTGIACGVGRASPVGSGGTAAAKTFFWIWRRGGSL